MSTRKKYTMSEKALEQRRRNSQKLRDLIAKAAKLNAEDQEEDTENGEILYIGDQEPEQVPETPQEVVQEVVQPVPSGPNLLEEKLNLLDSELKKMKEQAILQAQEKEKKKKEKQEAALEQQALLEKLKTDYQERALRRGLLDSASSFRRAELLKNSSVRF